ncbi:hypothetical protein F5X68DRAFT_235636 [Plectosphaerella plurivora]|uniref:Uncharacterized protein n=1 Tax=Plectosphaerella plurivora TaxID=936078 RepID=A0A9P8V435_9PEZI|nr:hypothetical protein F5X68DRAFT_235636 [Plectosphaerella plurivora]
MQFYAFLPLLLAGLAAANVATPAGNPNAIPTLERRATPPKRAPQAVVTSPLPVQPQPTGGGSGSTFPTLGNCGGLSRLGCNADPLCKWDTQRGGCIAWI